MSAGTPSSGLTASGSPAVGHPASPPQRVPGVVHADRIPAQLKRLDQWLLWRTIYRKGRGAKVPYSVHGGTAKSDDPATWASFEHALRCFREGEYCGIGFAFAQGDGLVGLDLDKCLDEEGNFVDEDAWAIYERFRDCAYIEVSPSGRGLRLFTFGSARQCGKGRDPFEWVEVYDYVSPRYLTVTGNVFFGGGAMADGQAALDWLQQEYMFQSRQRRNLARVNKRLMKIILELRSELEGQKQPETHVLHAESMAQVAAPPAPESRPPAPEGWGKGSGPRPLIESFDLGLLDW